MPAIRFGLASRRFQRFREGRQRRMMAFLSADAFRVAFERFAAAEFNGH